MERSARVGRVSAATFRRRGGLLRENRTYDRTSGKTNHKVELDVKPDSIILVEGCCLLSQIRAKTLTFSIILYVSGGVGRERKLDREDEEAGNAGRVPLR